MVALAGPALGNEPSCRDLGFSSNLLCSSCDDLAQFSIGFLEKDCRRCCQQEKADEEQVKFSSAVLEVCS